ncbi:carnosine synthase 1 [Lepisosteus oculatus]|uniref:carnosine synthase 1 n=1 Tax=Lepisosteus oculatus TaxID=7918 RepID=UPI0037170FB9
MSGSTSVSPSGSQVMRLKEGGAGLGALRQEENEEANMLFQLLQDALRELGLPLTRDGTFQGGAPAAGESYSAMCICVLGSPLPYLSLLLEAGTVSPGDALLCLSPTWLSCCPSPPSTLLLVHRAVSFDLGGRTQLLTFDPPRQVTYFLPCAPWAEQIQEVTRELDCPMGGSADLFQFWGDTLNARIALQRGGLCCPPTLAVVLSPLTDKLNYGGDEAGVCIVEVTDFMKEEEEERVRKAVQSFLESAVVQRSGKVVLKSSRAQWPGRAGIPVRFLDQKNLEAVWAGLCSLLPLLEKGEAALLEAYCPTLTRGARVRLQSWEGYQDANIPAPELSMKICAIVTRSPQDVPLLYKLVCRVGVSDSPLSHRDSLPQSLDTALREWGFSDPSFCLSVHRLLSQTAQRCLRVVMDTEAGLSPDQRGGIAAQTDLIGVDMLLCLSNGSAELTPVVLGLHSWQCLQSCALGTAAMTGKEERGEAESPGSLLHTPLTRSQRHLLRGKSVLVIGAGRISKKFVWESARDYGLKIFLVESDPSHFAAGLVSRFLAMDVTDHQQDEEHCARICAWLSQNDLQPDGCLCFWDDCIVLASLICQHLGLRGPPPEAVQTSKEKSRTHLHLLGLSSSSQDVGCTSRISRSAFHQDHNLLSKQNVHLLLPKPSALSLASDQEDKEEELGSSLSHSVDCNGKKSFGIDELAKRKDVLVEKETDIREDSEEALKAFADAKHRFDNEENASLGNNTEQAMKEGGTGMNVLSQNKREMFQNLSCVWSEADLKENENSDIEKQLMEKMEEKAVDRENRIKVDTRNLVNLQGKDSTAIKSDLLEKRELQILVEQTRDRDSPLVKKELPLSLATALTNQSYLPIIEPKSCFSLLSQNELLSPSNLSHKYPQPLTLGVSQSLSLNNEKLSEQNSYFSSSSKPPNQSLNLVHLIDNNPQSLPSFPFESASKSFKIFSSQHPDPLGPLASRSRSVPLLFPSPRIYAVPCAHVESAADIQKVVTDGETGDGSIKLRFPAIMKLEYGAGAVGVKRVDSLSESLAHLEKIAGDLREETDYPGIGLGWGNAMTLMEYIGGTEHDVDVVIFDGRLEGAFVSDNGPTRVPGFTETAAQMPTGLPRDKEAQLIEAAYRCCLGCGLRDGVFNVEMKMTPSGPKLIEINARMGGFYLRDWIREIFGVDILFCAFLIACGLAPRLPPQRLPALCHLTGVMCVVSQHLHALRTTASPPVLRELHRRGVLRLCEMEEELIAGEYEEPYCNVGVRAERPQDARLSLLTLSQALGIDSPHYPVSYFLSHFK